MPAEPCPRCGGYHGHHLDGCPEISQRADALGEWKRGFQGKPPSECPSRPFCLGRSRRLANAVGTKSSR